MLGMKHLNNKVQVITNIPSIINNGTLHMLPILDVIRGRMMLLTLDITQHSNGALIQIIGNKIQLMSMKQRMMLVWTWNLLHLAKCL